MYENPFLCSHLTHSFIRRMQRIISGQYSTADEEALKMDPVVKLPLDPKVLEDLVDKTKDYALMHGENDEILLITDCHVLIPNAVPLQASACAARMLSIATPSTLHHSSSFHHHFQSRSSTKPWTFRSVGTKRLPQM